MQIAIISDSHYSVDKVRQLFHHLLEIGINTVIHAGDFIGNGIDKVFADFPDISVWVAQGNCDSQRDLINAVSRLEHVTVGDLLRFQLEEVSFAVAHIPGMALDALAQQFADVVIHGHTHLPRIETYNKSLLLNPGSLMDGDGYMILTIPEMTVKRYFNY